MKTNEIIFNIEKEGETLFFSRESDYKDSLIEFECISAPGAKGPGFHVHTKQTETFYVLSGKMIGRIKGQEDKAIGPGESFVIPPGVVHTFYNGSNDEPLKTRITLEPALHFQWFMTEAAKVAISKNRSRNDASVLPEMAYIMWKCRDEQRIGGMPVFIENMIIGTLAFIARISGKTKNIAPKL